MSRLLQHDVFEQLDAFIGHEVWCGRGRRAYFGAVGVAEGGVNSIALAIGGTNDYAGGAGFTGVLGADRINFFL